MQDWRWGLGDSGLLWGSLEGDYERDFKRGRGDSGGGILVETLSEMCSGMLGEAWWETDCACARVTKMLSQIIGFI